MHALIELVDVAESVTIHVYRKFGGEYESMAKLFAHMMRKLPSTRLEARTIALQVGGAPGPFPELLLDLKAIPPSELRDLRTFRVILPRGAGYIMLEIRKGKRLEHTSSLEAFIFTHNHGDRARTRRQIETRAAATERQRKRRADARKQDRAEEQQVMKDREKRDADVASGKLVKRWNAEREAWIFEKPRRS